jgi:hypothetical protein
MEILLAMVASVIIAGWFRGYAVAGAEGMMETVRSLFVLLWIDPLGTAATLPMPLLKVTLAFLPFCAVVKRLPRVQLLRVPFWLAPELVLSPLLTLSCARPIHWFLLAALSACAWRTSRRRWLRWTCLAPIVFVYVQGLVVLNRGNTPPPLPACVALDGVRPSNLDRQHLSKDYYGVTPYGSDRLLLTGSAFSWVLRRGAHNWVYESKLPVVGRTPDGFFRDGAAWFTQNEPRLFRPNSIVNVTRDPTAGTDRIHQLYVPSRDMDMGPVGWSPLAPDKLYLAEVWLGAVWEVSKSDGSARRLRGRIGGFAAMTHPLHDGLLAGRNTADVVVYSTTEERVVERHSASIVANGADDLCPIDEELALGDLFGRLRFFRRDAQGHYHFAGGVALASGASLFAPRYVKYSPDCRTVAVSSWEGGNVVLVDRAHRTLVQRYHVGPKSRGMAFLGRRELAITDACGLTDIRF